MSKHATAIAVFRADYARRDAVLSWQAEIDAAAGAFPGFIESQLAAEGNPGDDWGAAVTFDSEKRLRTWLTSPERAARLDAGRSLGISDSEVTIVLIQGEPPPRGVGVFVHKVAPDHEAQFVHVEQQLRLASRSFPGHLGGVLLPPGDVRGVWVSVSRFDSDEHLDGWLTSPQRMALLTPLRAQLEGEFEQYTRNAPFGSIVRFEGAASRVTSKWRVAMVVLLVLYPTVMLLTRYLNPVFTRFGLDPGLSMWLGQVVSTALLTWVLMPAATRIFRRWLDPVDGAGLRVTLLGAGLLTLLCAATLAIFLSIPELQFWDH